MTTMKELARLGASDIDLRAVDFDKPVGVRGLHSGLTVTGWKCTVTSMDASRPMVIACRADPDEALKDAIERFVLIFGKKYRPGETVPSAIIDDGPKTKAKPAPKPAAPVADYGDDLI